MSNRLNMGKVEPGAYRVMMVLEHYMETTGLSQLHKELIRIRASQINGCAYCINMHTRDARKEGETEQRIYLLNAWRETALYTEEERTILALTEAVTLIANGGVSDELYNEAIKVLGEQKTAQVIMAANIINAWNRIGISTKMDLD